MSVTEMASVTKFLPYQRLGHDGFDGYDEEISERLVVRSRNWCKFKRVPIRRRFKLKVPSLRKFLRKVRLFSGVRLSCAKVLKRLKESQAHFGEIFAGNYMFIQVNPTSLKCLKKGHDDLNGLSSRYSLSKVA
ncbi:protein SIEVE ELEMENT OCCLUSION B [Fagus crenata]|jgi:hypothetical protein|uniref:Uncharacterized protein n=1 Tax=Fagus sylvatica TaxID=28930 RepID=A0A2N9ILK5_FAGSY